MMIIWFTVFAGVVSSWFDLGHVFWAYVVFCVTSELSGPLSVWDHLLTAFANARRSEMDKVFKVANVLRFVTVGFVLITIGYLGGKGWRFDLLLTTLFLVLGAAVVGTIIYLFRYKRLN